MMHTMQALEKTSRAPCTLSALIPSTSTDRSVLTEKTSQQRGKGGKNMHHSAHQTPGSAFFNPRLRLIPCPACPLLSPPPHTHTHPPLATQGHASRLCMTARNIPCHKCFPKASTSVTLSADKTSPQPLMECASHFFWMCQQFLAGWPDTASWRCLLRVYVCHCVYMYIHLWVCVCTCLYMFEYIYVFVFFFCLFLNKTGEKKGPCHSSTT